MSTPTDFDAIVIGSGITGGWAAKELTEKGLKVLVLERGRLIEHQKDYVHEFTPPWQAPLQTLTQRELDPRDYAIQRQVGSPFNWANRHYWINDRENPYVQSRPFRWHRADVLGGRSLLWARQVYRWSDLDFSANKADGHGNDWPIRYADIAPWYSHVERFIGVSGQAEGLPQLPDGEFLPPMPMNAVEKAVKAKVEAKWKERRLTIGRVANLTVPHQGRSACQYRYICNRGCSYGAYFSSLSSTLPAAQKTGLLTVRTDSVVEAIEIDPVTRRATGVRVIDARTLERRRHTARLVFLCASTLASVQVLLRSRSDAFPNGLGNQGDALGRYVVDQLAGGGFGVIPGFDDHNTKGRRPNFCYMARFRNLQGRDSDADFDRGYVYQCGAYREAWDANGGADVDLGAAAKARVAAPGRWIFFFAGWCEALPRADNRVVLDERLTDRFGLAQLKIDVGYGDNEFRMQGDATRKATEMLQAMDARDIKPFTDFMTPGASIHEMGGARMGLDPAQSVVNGRNQVHGVPNVFVTDGAAMASASAVNPSLTFMALTARAADFAAAQVRSGAL